MKLNSIQQQAATVLDQHLSLVAGAGTGKTRVLTERFIHIAKEQQGSYHNIVAITFTKKAAAEMKSRIFQRLMDENFTPSSKELNIQTIHSFCENILREFAVDLSLNPAFQVIEDRMQHQLLEQALDLALQDIQTKEWKQYLVDFHRNKREVKKDILALYQEMKNQNVSIEALYTATYQIHSCGDLTHFKGKLRDLEKYCQKKVFGKYVLTENYQKFMEAEQADLSILDEILKNLGKNPAKKSGEFTLEQKEEVALREEIKELAENFYLRKDEKNFSYYEAIFQVEQALEDRYCQLKREKSYMDFHDLIVNVSEALQREHIRETLHRRFHYVMVDEFQDTDPLQNQILQSLSPKNLFIVGDPKQSIYRFRGSDIHSYYELASQVSKEGKELLMMTNYRSISGLVNHVNAIFEKLIEPYDALEAFQKKEGVIEQYHLKEEGELASVIATLLEEYELSDIAILARSWSLIDQAEKILTAANIPSLHMRRKLCEFPVVKTVLHFIHSLFHEEDLLNFFGVIQSPYLPFSFDTTVSILNSQVSKVEEVLTLDLSHEKWRDFVSLYRRFKIYIKTLSVEKLMEKVVFEWNSFCVLNRQENDLLLELQKIAYQFYEEQHGTIFEFLEEVEHHFYEASIKGIHLMTLHGSKGLEYPAVIIYGVNDNIASPFPKFLIDSKYGLAVESEYSHEKYQKIKVLQTEEQVKEEQRLLYVGMTRAIERLILVGDLEKKASHSYYAMLQKEVFSQEDLTLKDFQITKDPVEFREAEMEIEDRQISEIKEYQYWENFSISDFLLFRYSPMDYYNKIYCYREKDLSNVEKSGKFYLVEPKIRGNIVHHFAKEDNGGEISLQIKRSFAHYREPWSLEKEKEIREYCENFRALNKGDNKYHEWEFYYNFEGFILHGYIDLIDQLEDGVEIIDFKTSDLGEEEMKAIYLPQLILYTLAYEKLTGEKVKCTKIYSLKRGEVLRVERNDLLENQVIGEWREFLNFISTHKDRKSFENYPNKSTLVKKIDIISKEG